MERTEIDRRHEYATRRKGKRGPVPQADVTTHKENNIPLIRDDPARKSSPGNRCKLDPNYILLLALIRKCHGTNEGILGSLFGVDQATVSRYIELADRVLGRILPTPEKFLKTVRDIDNPEAFVALFPEGVGDTTVVIDGTHVRFDRPKNAKERDPMYSKKKKYPSGNTVVVTSGDGMILGISKTHAGRVHDITITRDFLKTLGNFGEMIQGLLSNKEENTKTDTNSAVVETDTNSAVVETMNKLCNPSQDKIRVLADSGFQGIAADLSGAEVFIPIKKPRNGKLTDEQKLYNKKLSSKRVIVENAIGAAKHFRRISSIYEGSFERFNCEFQIAAGLANFRHMLRNNTYEHWSQKLELLNSDKGR